MEVYFATRKLEQALSDDGKRVRVYGDVMAKRLRLQLDRLAGAENLDTMRWFPGGCHQLHGDRDGQLAVTLTRNERLVFKPTADPPPCLDDGGLDWTKVTAVTVLEVTDYHGN